MFTMTSGSGLKCVVDRGELDQQRELGWLALDPKSATDVEIMEHWGFYPVPLPLHAIDPLPIPGDGLDWRPL